MADAPKKPDLTQTGFIKSSLLPVLLMFVIPVFSLWFFNHVEDDFDTKIREMAISQIKSDLDLTAEQRANAIAFYERVPVSKILASNDPDHKKVQDIFSELQGRYATFRWMKRTALICILTAVGAMMAAGIGLIFAARSHNALYWNLKVGWNVLRAFATIQVLGQGLLATALSYWVTAFWGEVYYIKLVGGIGILAIAGAVMIIAAIFKKSPQFMAFEGSLVTKEAAPELWQRVTEMTTRLNIAPPDQIFVGIDDNFFVTEHQVKVGEKLYEGRTLFASLSLLKTLSRSEADAVLAHEMAHFSGEDTTYSKRISPLLDKYVHYLEALYQTAISKPVFHFMFLFFNLYQFAINRVKREREFRADRIGAELTSPADIARSLVKIVSYCHYRQKIQSTLFETDANVEKMDVFRQIEHGFPKFMNESVNSKELRDADTPHPFDSHPPLHSRLENVGQKLETVLKPDETLPPVSDTWFAAINGAAEMEATQWKEFEDKFHEAHRLTLAWRYKPEGEVETAMVVKFFPEIKFTTKKGVVMTMDYEKLQQSDWEVPLYLSTITTCRLEDALGGKQLTIDYKHDDETKMHTVKIKYQQFPGDGAEFLQKFEMYYGRCMTAKNYLEEKAKEKVEQKEKQAEGGASVEQGMQQ